MLTREEKIKRAAEVVSVLETRYPSAVCALQYEGDPWRLLVMGRLSAQCTDARVNVVCRELFRRFPDAEHMAAAPVEEIEKLVFSCGVYKVKAQNIKDFSVSSASASADVFPTIWRTCSPCRASAGKSPI